MKNHLKLSLIFVVAVVILHFILRSLRYHIEFIMHQYWPLSIFLPKLPIPVDIITVIAIIVLGVALWKSLTSAKPFWQQVMIIWFLVIGTNLLQGFNQGFITPTQSSNDDGFDYWQDTAIIHNPLDILTHYVTLQPTLGYHSRVHPPLPLFIYYYLRQLLVEPWAVSLTLSLFSLSSLFFLKSWLARSVSEPTARFVALLFGLSPAFQIYSLASIDAVIATVFLASIWAFDRKPGHQKPFLTAIFLSLSMMMTFGVAWLIGLLLVIDYLRHRQFNQSLKVFGLTATVLVLLYLTTGYSYLTSFLTAASFEGAKNFFQSPLLFLSYCVTRLQDLLEPAVFLGPILILWIVRSWKSNLALAQISKAGLILFCLFLATGAYYTGETARAALYLILPLFAGLAPLLESDRTLDRRLLIYFILGQTILMQLFGYYTW